MQSNLDKYKSDLESLIDKGLDLHHAMQYECFPTEFEAEFKKHKPTKKKLTEFKKKLPSFREEYQSWYSEAQMIIKQLLPDRLVDFVKFYEKPKGRKGIEYGNYTIEDYLQSLRVTRGGEEIVNSSAAIPQFRQQLSILKSVKKRFESSLFDIKQLVQADLFDSELDMAQELLKNKFLRAAGVIAGVVLEKHLFKVCQSHNITIPQKDPDIGDLNDLVKKNEVIETVTWRFIQRLGDLRNLCSHNKKREPRPSEVQELIDGVSKISKSVF